MARYHVSLFLLSEGGWDILVSKFLKEGIGIKPGVNYANKRTISVMSESFFSVGFWAEGANSAKHVHNLIVESKVSFFGFVITQDDQCPAFIYGSNIVKEKSTSPYRDKP